MKPGTPTLAAMLLLLVAAGARGDVRLEATLDPQQVQPRPAGTTSTTGGRAELTIGADGAVEWELRVRDLTGFATGVAFRAGAAGERGDVLVALTNPPATGTHVGRFHADPALQAMLFAGRAHLDVDTAANPAGEIRGQVRLQHDDEWTCPCAGSTTRAFRACARRRVARLPLATRRSAAGRLLRRVARSAVCGAEPARIPRRTVACCLPWAPEHNVVIERPCAQATRTACRRLSGEVATVPGCRVGGGACANVP